MNGSTHHDLTRRGRNRFFFNNDGGTLCAAGDEAPISLERFVELAIGPLCHTQVDTFLWTLGTDPYHGVAHGRLSDWYCHDTKIGSRWGVDGRKFLTSGEWRIYENTRALMEQGYDPPAVVCEYGHAADLDVFISMRVNDVHDGRLGFLDHPNISPMKREHPDWLLGRTSRAVDFGRGRRTMLYNECWLDFDACEIELRKGRNELVFSVKGRNERISTPLSVEDVEVLVRYRPIWYAG